MAIWALGAAGFPAAAGATVITVRNVSSQVSRAQIRAAERALTAEVNTDLTHYWSVRPISFGPHGHLVVKLYRGRANPSAAAYHYPGGAAVGTGSARSDFMVVGHGGTSNPWTVAFSHEVLELLVDPMGTRVIAGYPAEVCDPVEGSTFRLRGVMLSDFVTPRWFGHGSRGRFDLMGVLHQKFAVAPGGFASR